MSSSPTHDAAAAAPSLPFEQDPYAAAYPETREFWEAATQGRFLLKTCEACGRAHWYPRTLCPMCGSDRVKWTEASGRGTVHAFSPAQRAEPPYILAYVTLDEGPTLMTNIVDADAASLKIGQTVALTWQAAKEGRLMPFFRPA